MNGGKEMFKRVSPYIGEYKKYTVWATVLMCIGIIAIESGNHVSLMDENGVYAHMVLLQAS